jgi:hypothetical protein
MQLARSAIIVNCQKKNPALFKIDANNVSYYNSDTLNFTIQSLILLKPKMFWGKSSIEQLKIANDVIYAVDKNRLHLFLYSLQGNPVNKIDLTKYDKNAKITNYRIYNDTLYIVSVHKVPFTALCLPENYSFTISKLRIFGLHKPCK